jgi:2-(1,2-epoxy-1,2-dihydrophenyl)acetyl-CoA isomerase
LGIAQTLAEGPPIAIGLIKEQLESAWTSSVPETVDAEASAQSRAFATWDLREGAAAFVEKRPARFLGH